MGSMAHEATVAWNFGDDAFFVARSFVHQLELANEWLQPLYQLVVSHQTSLNFTLPPIIPAQWDIHAEERARFTMHHRALCQHHFIDESPRAMPALTEAQQAAHAQTQASTAQEVTWSRGAIEGQVRDARAGALKFYGSGDAHLYAAIEALLHASWKGGGVLAGRKVAVFGIGCSTNPSSAAWYEAVCMAAGAQSCTSFRPCNIRQPTVKGTSRRRPCIAFEHPLIRSKCLPPLDASEYQGLPPPLRIQCNTLQHMQRTAAHCNTFVWNLMYGT